MTNNSQFKVTKTITLNIHWNTTDQTPERHLEALEETGMDRAHEMMLQGYREGELHDNITMPGDPEDGVDYRGWWTSEAHIERQYPSENQYAKDVTEGILRIDHFAEVTPEFIDQAAEDKLSVLQAVQSWFADFAFDCSTLKPLTGSVEKFGISFVHLVRPYIAISKESYQRLLGVESTDLFLTPSGVVVTYGDADNGYALMPINEETASLVLKHHMEAGDSQ